MNFILKLLFHFSIISTKFPHAEIRLQKVIQFLRKVAIVHRCRLCVGVLTNIFLAFNVLYKLRNISDRLMPRQLAQFSMLGLNMTPLFSEIYNLPSS